MRSKKAIRQLLSIMCSLSLILSAALVSGKLEAESAKNERVAQQFAWVKKIQRLNPKSAYSSRLNLVFDSVYVKCDV